MASLPLYKEIRDQLVESLVRKEWRPGEALPSEKDLAKRFSVAVSTIRNAIAEMVDASILVRKQGKGTYVASHNDPRAFVRFLRVVPNEGGVSVPQSVPLECWRAKAGQEAARILDIAPGAPITIVRRVLKFNGKPVVLDEIYLPGEIFQGLSREVLQEYQGSLYSLFETRFGVRMIRAEERIRAVAADRASADQLMVDEGSPLLSVERVTYTYGDKPVEWRRGLCATAEHYYLNEWI